MMRAPFDSRSGWTWVPSFFLSNYAFAQDLSEVEFSWIEDGPDDASTKEIQSFMEKA
jgi:hypothetical protein